MTAINTAPNNPDPNAAAGNAAPAGEKLYAGKFKSVEDLEKGYTEAQTLISSRPAPIEMPDDAGIEHLLGKAKVSEADLRAEFAANGRISDDQYKALKAVAPVSRALIEQNLAAVMTAESVARETAIGIAGGEVQFNTLLNFAKALPDAEKAEIEKGLKSFNTYRDTVTKLKTAYEAKYPPANGQVEAGTHARPAGGFRSHGEYVKAQREATKQSGSWRENAEFMQRVAATDPSVITAL